MDEKPSKADQLARKWGKSAQEKPKEKKIRVETTATDQDKAILNQFYVPRKDDLDCYKQTTRSAVSQLAKAPPQLLHNDEHMFQEVAINWEVSTELDAMEEVPERPRMSQESLEQLQRLPSWLQAMIRCRYEVIHTKFGKHTHHFLKLLANRIDAEYLAQKPMYNESNLDDAIDEEIIRLGFPLKATEVLAEKVKVNTKGDITFRVAQAIGKWKAGKQKDTGWSPIQIKTASDLLRSAMTTRASAADLALVAEDEHEIMMAQGGSDDDDNDAETSKPKWDSIVANKRLFRQGVETEVEAQLRKFPPKHLRTKEDHEYIREVKERRKRRKSKAAQSKAQSIIGENVSNTSSIERKQKATCWSWLRGHPLFKGKKEREERRKKLIDRALYRRYSKIFHNECGDHIGIPHRFIHHFRHDESFHAYVVLLTRWTVFRYFIMLVILANAILLALQTGETQVEHAFVFEIFDIIFLSIYTVEFILKLYASPYGYWSSGFNIFDFIILLLSLTKNIFDWLDLTEISFLRVLLLIRALRILRGVSLSVQIQILISALVKTIRTHMLSVIVLLVLLMYIGAIIAYYFFGKVKGLVPIWGNIGPGMLRIFSYVTMEGWTDILEKFEDADRLISGRVFSLICIILGNFLFSNIFIAIIIMNISDASDAYRERQHDIKDEIVDHKKDVVFRRQKLDMRQLLARQRLSPSTDFYQMGSQFIKLLRHDDLVAMSDICTSPLWMDSLYKTSLKCRHTSLMNLYREMGDTLLEAYHHNQTNKYQVEPITRSRYNYYMKMKARLSMLKREMSRYRNVQKEPAKFVFDLPKK